MLRAAHAIGNCHATDKYARKLSAQAERENYASEMMQEYGIVPTMKEWLEVCRVINTGWEEHRKGMM
jgi:hypothetical protein